jgi:hypothetical protein
VLRQEMADSRRLRPPLLDSSLQEVLGFEAELWASRRDLGQRRRDTRPESRVCGVFVEKSEREKGGGFLGFSGGGRDLLTGVGGWRPSSCASNHRRWIERLAELHWAASARGRRRLKAVFRPGAAGLVWWAVTIGLQPGKLLTHFFLLIHFLLLFL